MSIEFRGTSAVIPIPAGAWGGKAHTVYARYQHGKMISLSVDGKDVTPPDWNAIVWGQK